MRLADNNLPFIYLKPGELYVAEQPTLVSTVLGSCVSITMCNRAQQLGAICHALLAEGPEEQAFRYVDQSILYMLRRFEQVGLLPRQIEVKMFGGADILAMSGRQGISVGRQNVAIARQVLAAEGLTIAAEDVGGERGRKIFFKTHTGEVFLKRLNRGEFRPEQ